MDNVTIPRNGDLREGYFYQFDVPCYETARCGPYARNSIWSQYPVSDDEYCEAYGLRPQCYFQECGGYRHLTSWVWFRPQVELIAGNAQMGVIPLNNHNRGQLLTEEVAKRLRATQFRGWDLERATVVGEKRSPKGMELYMLNALGGNCIRPWSVHGAPNACPFCGKTKLVCQECGQHNFLCDRCGNEMWVIREKHQGVCDKRLIRTPVDECLPNIVDGHLWDGSDFFQCSWSWQGQPFVTRRVVDWFLSQHVAPMVAETVLVDVSQMTPEQRQVLEAAKQPIS